MNQVSQNTNGKETDLFTPLKMGPIELKNRIVMAPLTRNRAGQGNVPQNLNIEYYGQRASAGLIITEASQISPQGAGYPNTPGIYNQEQVAGWKPIVDAVHAKGGHIFLQLWHVGRISHPSMQPEGALPVSASALKPEGDAITYEGLQPFVTPRALETNEIPAIIEQFKTAAINARDAGFDGVEIHAANGYLLDQFLRDGSNKRTDQYGGSVENRIRLTLEVTQAITEILGGDRVGIRISPINSFNSMNDSKPKETFLSLAEQLNQFNLAYLHVVEHDMANQNPSPFDCNSLRKAYQGLYMANGGYDLERATTAIQTGSADMVSFGQLYISNPDLVERFTANADLNTSDPDTFYGGDAKGYTDYPMLDT